MTTSFMQLPPEFSDLEVFCSKWLLATEQERYITRIRAPYAELVEMYERMTPRLPAIIEHLNNFPLEDMPQRETSLMHLTFSLMEVAHAVELWKQPDLPEAFEPERLVIKLAGGII
ncbi:hypothetical protein VVT58_24035 (plasmid) [Sphingobium sp. SJ10-10]|uniref:hypothetical protein n=1 Tax=Sphingobium sp. SJ10-10 TaxID=3114999 RepID=UPI002E191A42|nr:hypothetical protein [Sphingobium sp. SJ10-10]